MIKREEKLNTFFIGLGKRLKEFRIQKEMKQSDFADVCGIERNSISKIENGKRGLTDMMLYNIFIKFPDFDAYYILTGKKKEEERAVTEGVSEEG